MEIALLNEKIVVEKSEVQSDEIGNRKNVWHSYYRCFATVGGESGKEYATAGVVNDEIDITFTIRWCKKAASIKSNSHRIIFNDEIYDIVSIDHMNFKKKSLKFKCRKVHR